jgi:hypothetical protein
MEDSLTDEETHSPSLDPCWLKSLRLAHENGGLIKSQSQALKEDMLEIKTRISLTLRSRRSSGSEELTNCASRKVSRHPAVLQAWTPALPS